MMKRYLFLFAVTGSLFLSLNGSAQAIKCYMQNCVFLSMNTDTPYAETYLSIPGKTVHYVKNSNGKYEGAIQITLMYLHDSTVAAYDKYLLKTPEVADTSKIGFNLLDLRRVSLPEGDYTVEVQAKDLNNPQLEARVTQDMKVKFDHSKVSFSNIEFVESFQPTAEKNLYSKSGYDIKPYPSNFYPPDINKLTFYGEIYSCDKVAGNENVFINYSIKYIQKDEVVGDYFRFSKQQASTVNYVFSEFDISDLPSGNYLLSIAVKNSKNQLLGEQAAFFQRSNNNAVSQLSNISLLNINHTFAAAIPNDSMTYYLKCLNPTSEMYEKDLLNTALASHDTLMKKQIFYNFWTNRNQVNPELAWGAYRHQVAIAEANYKTSIHYGFESDRGRVFLQYGPPNNIESDDHDPSAYPYEIWHYYKLPLTKQTNIRFVFYNPDLAGNDYRLIHSEAYGEVNNPRWKYLIYDRVKEKVNYTDLDNTNYPDAFGSHLDYNYNINH